MSRSLQGMNQLFLRFCAFTVLNMIGAGFYIEFMQNKNPIPPWETSSVLQTMPHNQHVDVVILGTSHARSLSGCPASAAAIESALESTVLNLAKNAAGPVPLRLYIKEFFARGNTANLLIYFADPWAFYSPKWNEEHGFLMDEPFEPRFFIQCAIARKSPRQLLQYARRGFQKHTYTEQLQFAKNCHRHLDAVIPEIAAHRASHLYGRQPSDSVLTHYSGELSKLLERARDQNARVIIATPPTLLGTLPGMDAFVASMHSIAEKHDAHYFNFADVMQNTAYFMDHDHLNANGTDHFASNHLRTAIDAVTTSTE